MEENWEIVKHGEPGRVRTKNELELPTELHIDERNCLHLPRRLIHTVFGERDDHKLLVYYSPELKQLHLTRASREGEDVHYLRRSAAPNAGYYLSGMTAFFTGKHLIEISDGKIILKEVIAREERAAILAEPLHVPNEQHKGACMFCEGGFSEREKFPYKEYVCWECALIKAYEERQVREQWREELSRLVQRTIALQKAITAPFQYPSPEEISKEMDAKRFRKRGLGGDKS